MSRLIILFSLITISSLLNWHSFAQEPDPIRTPSATPERTPTATRTVPTITPMGNLTQQLSIISPVQGQALQGTVPIRVFTNISEIKSMELAFAYSNDPTETWFLINTSSAPIIDEWITEWDTSLISDGNYDLLLVAILADGNKMTATIEGIRVRNYSPIETNTPTPVTPTSEEEAVRNSTPTPTSTTKSVTQTPFPRNPASLSTDELTYNLGKGVVVTVGLFALIGLYIVLRKSFPS